MMMTKRRDFLTTTGLALASAALPLGAMAQAFPSKPIRLIVPFPAGGATDLIARVISVPLGDALAQPIILDYKAGADGIIAGEATTKAAPDGYTLLLGSATGFSAAPAMHKSVPYDPLTDFTPVARLGTFAFFLFVTQDLPVHSVAELLAYIRANPGKINYGTATGTAIMATAQLAQLAKLEMVHIPYKGDAPLMTDALAGRLQLMFGAGGPAIPHVRNGKLRALATLLPNRSPLLPEVPTLAQAGIKLSITPWAGLFGPAGLPRDVVDRLGREVAKLLARPDIGEQLGGLAFDPQASTPDELRAFVREQLDVWKGVAAQASIQPA